jgi:hypothetical protein
MGIQTTKQINIVVFAFGTMCGASLGWALPDGNLLVTAFLAVAAGMFILGIWLGFQFLRKLWVKR